ncbi:BTB/POZ domain-containing protein 9-like [Centruroides sculpturatus]|uniref:BTB/POZ domain-containing protein 9-like n=1 Tax=Centruroides sculpturatus TaxID=218467 RepID=UPI000C6D0E9A|nr:BTB/POZ domain-containing protein 9-like [Centruroides sculpturatus]
MTRRTEMEIILQVGSSKTLLFKCEKLRWSNHSTVFASKFRNVNSIRKINITDIEAETFIDIYQYVECGKFNPENAIKAMDIYIASTKYEMNSLSKECEKYIYNTLSLSNLCYIHDLAIKNCLIELKNKCKEMITKNASVILHDKNFLNASPLVMNEILKNNDMVVAERDVYSFLINWAKSESKRTKKRSSPGSLRRVIDSFIIHIRFLSMSPEDFIRGPGLSKILNHNEASSILMNIIIPNCSRLPVWCNREDKERGTFSRRRRINSCNS